VVGKKGLFLSVPEEVAELWKLQAFIERRSLKDIVMEAMDRYLQDALRKEGFEPEEFDVVEEEIDVKEISEEGWKLLKEAGVDVEALKAQVK